MTHTCALIYTYMCVCVQTDHFLLKEEYQNLSARLITINLMELQRKQK